MVIRWPGCESKQSFLDASILPPILLHLAVVLSHLSFYTLLLSSVIMDTIHNFPHAIEAFQQHLFALKEAISLSILLNKEDLWGNWRLKQAMTWGKSSFLCRNHTKSCLIVWGNPEQPSCTILQTWRACPEPLRWSESCSIFEVNRNAWKDNEAYLKTRGEWVATGHIRGPMIMNSRDRLTIKGSGGLRGHAWGAGGLETRQRWSEGLGGLTTGRS